MTRWIVILVAVLAFIGTNAYAQESQPGPGTLEVTAIPGGGTFFVSSDTEPTFGNYDIGGALTYRLNRLVSVEGELGSAMGVSQNLQLGGTTASRKTPNMLGYTGNVVVSGPVRYAMTPYLAGGIGGLTVFQRAELGVDNTENHLTGNIGGGVKWYVNRHWGLRGDYRFLAVRSSNEGPAFFGQEARYGHRIYGGVVVNVMPSS